jgi:protein SCO1/2
MNSMRFVPVLLLALVVSVVILVVASRMGGGHPKGSADELSDSALSKRLEPLFPAPEFRGVDQSGRPVTRESFRGKVWVADFIFTQCKTVCPLITSRLVQLQRRLVGVDARFVSFSVDPAHDSPEVLAAYATKWAPDETRWTLVANDEAGLKALAAGFHVTAEKGSTELDPILHSSVFLLIDGEGQVRGVFHSDDRDDLKALEGGVRALTKTQEVAPRALPTTGEGLYHELSCANCHERPELAPPLRGLAGKKRELETGLLVTADEAYVRESILAPEARRVRGYPLRMPAYDGQLAGAALETLVAWVLARPEEPGVDGGESAEVAVDPVCHMGVRVTPDALSAEVDGGRVYFCSEYCRERFLGGARDGGSVHRSP